MTTEVYGPIGEAIMNRPIVPVLDKTGNYSMKELLALRRTAFEAINPALVASWDRHFKGKYGREAGSPERLKESSPKDLESWSLWLGGTMKDKRPCFSTARHYLKDLMDNSTMSLDTLFFDFDHEEHPEKALKDAAFAYDILSVEYDCEPRLRFSGSKGAHLLLDLQEPSVEGFGYLYDNSPLGEFIKKKIKERKTEMLKRFTEKVMDPMGLLTHDREVGGDLVRLERIANTRHQKTGLWCIPLKREELDWDISRLRELAKEPRLEPVGKAIEAPMLKKVMEEIGREVQTRAAKKKTARTISREMGLQRPRVRRSACQGAATTHCPGISAALAGVGESARHLAAFGLMAFWQHTKVYDPEMLRQWNKYKNQPSLDDRVMDEVIARKEPGNSFCYFLNLAGLCPPGCGKLK